MAVMIRRTVAVACLLSAALFLLSCSGNASFNGCTTSIQIDPNPASADHSLAPPGNQVTFTATYVREGDRCPLVATVIGDVDATWTTSDGVNTSILNQKTSVGTNGLATCVHATPTPATIFATNATGVQSKIDLTCK
jgi:hypothetical protein